MRMQRSFMQYYYEHCHSDSFGCVFFGGDQKGNQSICWVNPLWQQDSVFFFGGGRAAFRLVSMGFPDRKTEACEAQEPAPEVVCFQELAF